MLIVIFNTPVNEDNEYAYTIDILAYIIYNYSQFNTFERSLIFTPLSILRELMWCSWSSEKMKPSHYSLLLKGGGQYGHHIRQRPCSLPEV